MSDHYNEPTNSNTPYPDAQYQPSDASNTQQAQYGSPYQQAPYPQYGDGYGRTPDREQGEKLAQTSMILGIISIFFLGIVLGPMAIYKASQAQKLNADATVGKITGWIGTIIAGLGVLWLVFMIFVIAVAGSSGY